MPLCKANYFSKLELRRAKYLVRMGENEEWKIMFRLHFGHFQYQVMPFILLNAAASFQHLINNTLPDHFDIICSASIDDILVYSETLVAHQACVRKILLSLQIAELYLKPEKCGFHVQSIKYLCLIISANSITIDP